MWRKSANDALRRVTGYQLQRASAHQHPHGKAAEIGRQRAVHPRRVARLTAQLDRANARLDQANARLDLAKRRLDKAEARAKQLRRRRPGQPKLIPRHYDEAAVEILRRVESRTMTDFAKLFALVEATRYVVTRGIPGGIVECGVWRGGSMQAVALTLMDQGMTDRPLHLFDTFEGMPPPTDKDRRPNSTSAEELMAIHEGFAEDTVPNRAPAQISILRLDTDWYESTRHELAHLYDRLSPGRVLIIDDYGDWEGARLATDEFMATLAEPLLPIGSGRLAVKPVG